MEALSLTSFITPAGAVRIVRNEMVEGNPLITPMMNKDQTPKTDMVGRPLGSMMLEQHTSSLNGSFLNNRRRVAFITGPIEALQKLVDTHKLEHGKEIPGKIIVKESITPMWEGQIPKKNPTTDKEIGVFVGMKFYPVYMKMFFTENKDAKDTMISTPEDVIAAISFIEAIKQNATVAAETAKIPGVNTEQPAVVHPIAIEGSESTSFVDEVVRTDAQS